MKKEHAYGILLVSITVLNVFGMVAILTPFEYFVVIASTLMTVICVALWVYKLNLLKIIEMVDKETDKLLSMSKQFNSKYSEFGLKTHITQEIEQKIKSYEDVRVATTCSVLISLMGYIEPLMDVIRKDPLPLDELRDRVIDLMSKVVKLAEQEGGIDLSKEQKNWLRH